MSDNIKALSQEALTKQRIFEVLNINANADCQEMCEATHEMIMANYRLHEAINKGE